MVRGNHRRLFEEKPGFGDAPKSREHTSLQNQASRQAFPVVQLSAQILALFQEIKRTLEITTVA